MINLCKKNLKGWLVAGLATLVLLVGCATEPDDSVPKLLPDNGINFWIFPNDEASNDSASNNLSHGLVLNVHPNAEYSLSFDADTVAGEPRLLLYRITFMETGTSVRAHRVRVLKPTLENSRYVYRFLCEERESVKWVAVLEKKGTFYGGSTRNVRLAGDGAYSDHLSLNLVFVGNVASKLDGFTAEELAEKTLEGFQKYYTSITIDDISISYANEHPTYGNLYPANKPWYAGYSDNDEMMQKLGGGWPGRENALDLILVDYIDEIGLMGYSYLFSGNLGSGEGSTVVLGANVKTNSGKIPISLDDIVSTAVHESGHFFGLRHTTSSTADMMALGDYSVVEDGLTDTPYCPELLASGLLKRKSGASVATDIRVRGDLGGYRVLLDRSVGFALDADFDGSDCPDASNLMFPMETDVVYEGLSKQQLDLVRKNLMIFPH